MKGATFCICLMMILAGCSVGQDPVSTPIQSDTQTQIYEQRADTPVHPRTPGSTGLNIKIIELSIHERINKIRLNEGLSILEYDARLASIGRYHSWEMAEYDYVSHNGSGGLTYYQRLLLFDYQCTYPGENIATHPGPLSELSYDYDESLEQSIARKVVVSWMNSPEHRKNILSPDFEAEGIGVFITESGAIYVTQELCG